MLALSIQSAKQACNMLNVSFKQIQVNHIHVSTVQIKSFDTKSLTNEAVKAVKSKQGI